jgi:gamma-glutamylcyclotransferase (GGCT)/AIG2-like uncharacterized protein YtfP
MARLFTYGTLMLAEVMEIVAGRRFAARRAELPGYRRRLLRDAVYPGLVPAAGETVEGVLWEGVDPHALARIDRFEGALYERPELRVSVAPGESCAAFVYLLRPEHRALATDSAWREDDFRERHLRGYLAACRAFAQELRDDRSAP